MRVTKVKKEAGDQLLISLEKDNNQDNKDQMSLVSGDSPSQTFSKAFDALKSDVISICEQDCSEKDIHMIGVSISYKGEKNSMCVVLSAKRVLKASPQYLILNTPCKLQEIKPNQTGQEISKEMLKRVKELNKEAIKFFNGVRLQTNLFEEKKDGSKG